MKTKVFTLDGQTWGIKFPDGSVIPPCWNSKGAALAAIQVEEIRRARKKLKELEALDKELSNFFGM